MPELPEVETMRRGVAAVQGGVVDRVDVYRSSLRPITIRPRLSTLRKHVCGRAIISVERFGKRVVWRIQDAGYLVIEPRMTGLLLVADPPNEQHLRIHWRLHGCRVSDVWYWDRRGLGSVYYLAAQAFARRFSPPHLGPDALRVSAEELQAQFANSNREIKVALLDQTRLAGIGNLYASEILHRSGIRSAGTMSGVVPLGLAPLAPRPRRVLLAAIRYEGSTLGDGTYRNALNRDGSYQNHHRVYRKQGCRCRHCRRGIIRRIVQAQRSTFYCPICQVSSESP